jgi:AraC-like DNA-binding protein
MIPESKNINILIKNCTGFLREYGYSEACISVHLRRWQRGIQQYMDASSIIEYSEEIGERYLRIATKNKAPSTIRAVTRNIHILTDFLSCGTVRKRIVHLITYPLPGEIGILAEEFLEKLKQARRCDLTINEHRRILSYFIEGLSLRSIHGVSESTEVNILDFINAAQHYVAFSPGFFSRVSFSKKNKQYGFFSYSVNEALHLSDKEKATIIAVFKSIDEELQNRIDDFSRDVIISQSETLLNYSNRFYKRQFLTRKAISNDLLQQSEEILDDYFNKEKSLVQGIPTVQYLAEALNISPGYLSDMLRSLTGQNAQQHIHNKLIEKAKEKISTTKLTISEIAYELGFEHPSSFNKLFKSKTNLSPLDFGHSFN